MIFWIDAQLSPEIAEWLSENYEVKALSVKDVGHRDSKNKDIFQAAAKEADVVITKDKDFVNLLERFGPPPKILWLTIGNTSNKYLKQILDKKFATALKLLQENNLVEITK